MRRGARSRLGLLAAASLALLAVPLAAEETVRIAVAQVRDQISLAGPELVVTDPAAGEVVQRGGPALVAPTDQGIAVGGRVVAATRLVAQSSGAITVRGLALEREVEVFREIRGGRPEIVIVHTVPIEAYVAATVSAEMPASFPAEALKAQAVVTRTFAIFRKFNAPERPYHMEAGVIDQVFGGTQRISESARAATVATAGEVLTFGRQPVRAYYHSCCAGHTESAREGWGQALPYLPGVKCPYDGDCPSQQYTARIPLARLARALLVTRVKIKRIASVKIADRTATGRVARIAIETDRGRIEISGEDLRRLVGYDVVKSRLFDLSIEGDVLVVTGRGSGHGVGLCQWGARGLALKQRTYDAILGHYFPRTKIMKMY
ncbi:MAG: SpoIID/LytB domain-containing protein [Deltaproteobacteria bacterium]|nr:SpoIID/LytB domain-containing protein [Deltaproteobacteria bacterium]